MVANKLFSFPFPFSLSMNEMRKKKYYGNSLLKLYLYRSVTFPVFIPPKEMGCIVGIENRSMIIPFYDFQRTRYPM